MHSRNGLWGAIPVLAAALVAGCSSGSEAPLQAKITEKVEVKATVLAVDKPSREITLRRPDGSTVVVVAGPEVRNFDQIAAGSTVTARYVVSLSVRRLRPDEPDTQTTVGLAAARAKLGEAPAGAIGAGLTLTVKVKSVDVAQHLVAFADATGGMHAVQAERDEGKRFVAGLKPGDRVELAYGEVLALGVD